MLADSQRVRGSLALRPGAEKHGKKESKHGADQSDKPALVIREPHQQTGGRLLNRFIIINRRRRDAVPLDNAWRNRGTGVPDTECRPQHPRSKPSNQSI